VGDGKVLRVKSMEHADEWRDAHLLYLAGGLERGRVVEVLAATRGWPVLTVSAREGFLADGGGVELATVERRGGRTSVEYRLQPALVWGGWLRFEYDLKRFAGNVRELEKGPGWGR
jgi:hypothetical protein